MIVETSKIQLRTELHQRRDAYKKSHDPKTTGKALLKNLIDAQVIPPGAVIGSYWPTRSEVDIRPLLTYFHEHGHTCGLPVVQSSKRPLLFRQWKPGNLLVSGLYNILAPDDEAPLVNPDVLFVPILGFDIHGHRLGHGEGYYDRTLEYFRNDHKIIAIGIAFDCQEVPDVPYLDHDQPMNYVLTPTRVIEIAE